MSTKSENPEFPESASNLERRPNLPTAGQVAAENPGSLAAGNLTGRLTGPGGLTVGEKQSVESAAATTQFPRLDEGTNEQWPIDSARTVEIKKPAAEDILPETLLPEVPAQELVLEEKAKAAETASLEAVDSRSSKIAGAAGIAEDGRSVRATMQVRRIEPWSALKFSAVISVVGFLVWMVAVGIIYIALDGMGVWNQVESSFGQFTTAEGTADSEAITSAGNVLGIAALLGFVNMFLFTALATVSAFIYNMIADLIGGVEVTLADLD